MFSTATRRLAQTSTLFRQIQVRKMTSESRPTGPIANKGIELFTFGTPNGHKASIILEEIKAAYGNEYTTQALNISENIQKEPWFTEICPNGRIPAIVDHDRSDFSIFEGAAILFYLTRHYDPEHKFCFTDPDDVSRAEQWISWQHGGIGPMQGQSNHFYRLAPEKVPYAIVRYVGETERLYGILDKRLEGREYIVGSGKGKYSIADIASFSWVNYSSFGGVEVSQFKNVKAWADRVWARDAVKKGCSVPHESTIINPSYEKRLGEETEFAEKERELKSIADEAKKQYGYKYSSP